MTSPTSFATPSLLSADSVRKPVLPSGLRPAAPLAARALPILQPQRAPSQLSLFPPPGAARSLSR